VSQGSKLSELIHDIHRFILFNRGVIQDAPLQVYHSALIFSPSGSLTRYLFQYEEPQWATAKSAIDSTWGACMQTLEGHRDWVSSVVFSPDGTRIVSGSIDNTVRIWDASNGGCLHTLEGHSDSVNSVVFSPDGTRVASGSNDNTVRIWDAGNGGCLHTLEGHNGSVRSVVFSPDGTRVVSGSEDNTVRIWDAGNGGCLHILEGHSDSVRSLVFSPDGARIASGSWDNTVRIWDTGNGGCLQTLKNVGPSMMFDASTLGNIAWTGTSNTQRICETPQHLTYCLNSNRAWITSNGQNAIWLPSEYRPSSFAFTSSTMVIGCRSGRVLIFDFSIT